MPASPPDDPRRRLPAVDRLLAEPRLAALQRVYGRDLVRVQLRAALERLRSGATGGSEPATAGDALEGELDRLPSRLAAELERTLGRPLARVLNATGVFLHTNLGRAPLPADLAEELAELSTAACDLELDLASGERGDRARRAGALLAALTGAEAALAVNNNAAALLLALGVHARGREVVVSRGELVEIGGSFRIPEILAAAGTRLVEVGTTNRTHLADYERALAAPGADVALLLKVLPSNFRARGFVAEVGAAELAGLGARAGVPVVVDEGSGLLRPSPRRELADHPSLAELVAAGVGLACGSGDKLAGGPQAGMLVGRAALVEPCRRHPLYRALRLGRLAQAALEGVLRRHLAGAELPLERLWPEPAAHRERCRRLAAAIGGELVEADAFVGGGSAPDEPIRGEAVALAARSGLAARLRQGSPPVVGYVRDGRLILDLRTVDPADDDRLADAVFGALADAAAPAGNPDA